MKCYTVQEVAALMGVGKHYIYELIYTGKLKASRLSERRFRVQESDLKDYLDSIKLNA